MRRLNSRLRAHGVPAPSGLTRTTRLLLVATPFLLALLTPTTLEAQKGSEKRRAPAVEVRLSSAIANVCPGQEAPAQVRLWAEGDGAACGNARYTWSATGGRIKGEGPKVVWDFAGTRVFSDDPRNRNYYEVTLTVEGGPGCAVRRAVSAPARVVVWGCTTSVESRSPVPPRAPAAVPCPSISLCCHSRVAGGVLGPFVATLGNTGGVKPTFDWKLSAGRIHTGSGTGEITVDAKGLKRGGTVLATVEVGGYGPRCSATCLATLPDGADGGRLATLSVSVKSARDDRPVSRAKINVYQADGALVGRAEADARVPYVRGGWTPGEYRVEVSADRFETQQSNVTLAALSTGSVAFTLKPASQPVVGPSTAPTAEPTPAATPSPPADPTPTPARSWISEPLVANAEEGSNWRWLLLGGVVGLVVAGYLLTLNLAGRAAGEAAARVAEATGAAAGATPQSDRVHCTVYAPPTTRPGDMLKVQVFAHLKEQAEQLACLSSDYDEEARKGGSAPLKREIERGKELTFRLVMPKELTVEEDECSLVWNGEPDCVRFTVTVPEDCKPKVIWGKVEVLYESVPAGQVEFKLKVVTEAAPTAAAPAVAAPVEQTEVMFTRAFISYSRKDSVLVLEKVQMLEAQGIECFLDMMTFKSGEDWKEKINYYIDLCDVFFLFWSSASKDSAEVQKEILYALQRRETAAPRPVIKPIPIEGPPVVPPPPYLSHLHFDDRYRYFIKAKQAEQVEASAQMPAAPGAV